MSKITQRLMIGAALAAIVAAPLAAQTQYGQGQRGGDRGGDRSGQPAAQPQPAAPQTPAQAVQQAIVQAIGGNVLVIYPDSNFRGPGTTFNQSNDRSNIEFESARVRGGWQLCEGFNFTGRCVSVSSDFTNVTTMGLNRVGSFRPLGIVPPPPPAPPPGERGDNANLRGRTAAFYPRPAERGFRIEIDERRGREFGRDFDRNGNGNGNRSRVERDADQFCRQAGFTDSRYQTTETIGRRTYLADVLCVRN